MIFSERNRIMYGQDHRFWKGIPPGIDFDIEPFNESHEPGRFVLRAKGYGVLGGQPGDYGNGALYVFGLTARQARKFRKHVKEKPQRAAP